MSGPETSHLPRFSAVLREGGQVTPLELFFDLVFALTLTQCTAFISDARSGESVLEALLVLGVLWWSWGGYAWLTSVVDPEEGGVRIVMFLAMAAFLVAALCIPRAFGSEALLFAGAYAVVRVAHLALFTLASSDDPELRRSVQSLAGSTAVGAGLLFVGAAIGGAAQVAIWGVALAIDLLGPFLFGIEGWRLVPAHFAERHGLIIIIALGESIVALGAGARSGVSGGVVAAAVLGMLVVAALWWAYFDVVSLAASRRLSRAAAGRERNAIARDSYSYLHFPMLAGIALVAVGLKRTLADVSHPLGFVPAASMLGGSAMYLLAHVGFRLRNMRTLNRQRLLCAALLLALLPLEDALHPPSLLTLGMLAAVLTALIGYETLHFAEGRQRLRRAVARERVAE